MLNACVQDEFLSQYFCRVMCTCRYMSDSQVNVKVLSYAELIAVVLKRYVKVLLRSAENGKKKK